MPEEIWKKHKDDCKGVKEIKCKCGKAYRMKKDLLKHQKKG
jgi:hypothetical protein